MIYKRFGKRVLDLFLSAVGIVVLIPVWIVLVFVIKLDSRGPVLFKQKRVGIHKKSFYIWKFRTMRTDTPSDIPTHMMVDAGQWITRAGRFLRRTSLDELPQLFNVLRGHMSLVGPRPALWNQDDLIAERDKVGANDVRPGLTGWAQINGRDELKIEEKARLDGEYVRHLGLVLDIKCIIGTIASVLKHEGIVEGGTGIIEHSVRKTGL